MIINQGAGKHQRPFYSSNLGRRYSRLYRLERNRLSPFNDSRIHTLNERNVPIVNAGMNFCSVRFSYVEISGASSSVDITDVLAISHDVEELEASYQLLRLVLLSFAALENRILVDLPVMASEFPH